MSTFAIRSTALILGGWWCFLASAAQAAIKVVTANPRSVQLEAGKSVTVVLRGAELNKAKGVEVYQGGRRVREIE